MIIYMYKEKGIGYIYAFFNGKNTYTCQCEVSALALEELYCSSNGQLPLEEYIRSHGSHIRRNTLDIPLEKAKTMSYREFIDQFQFFHKGNYILNLKEVKSHANSISKVKRYHQSWLQILLRGVSSIPARETEI